MFIKGNAGRVLPYCQTLLCKNKDEHYSTLSKLKNTKDFTMNQICTYGSVCFYEW